MIKIRRNVILALFALVATACGQAAREPVVADAWANATPPAATVGAVYLQVTTTEADTLLAATTTVADHVEMHTSSEEDGMMRMRPLPNVQLAAGKPFTFSPMGAHFMLMGLRQPLQAGARFPMTLQFEKAGPLTVQVEVVEPGTR